MTKTKTDEQIEELVLQIMNSTDGKDVVDAVARLEAFAKILATQRDRYRAKIEYLEKVHAAP